MVKLKGRVERNIGIVRRVRKCAPIKERFDDIGRAPQNGQMKRGVAAGCAAGSIGPVGQQRLAQRRVAVGETCLDDRATGIAIGRSERVGPAIQHFLQQLHLVVVILPAHLPVIDERAQGRPRVLYRASVAPSPG